LKQLDALAENAEPDSAEARMEAAAAAIRLSGERTAAGAERSADDLEALIAARRRKREEKSAGFCPKCGRPVQTSDAFCPKCGGQL
jgi:hypothetical protein